MTLCARRRGQVAFWLLTFWLVAGALDGDRSGDWKDWLLDEAARRPSSDADSGPLARRITPKSVFVAPSFSGCSEGYRQDAMGRCVKLVKVNQAAQLDFILQKLNSKFAHTATKKEEEKDSGPFHVNIPLGYATKENVSKADTVTTEHVVPETVPLGTTSRETPTQTDGWTSETVAPLMLNETDHRLLLENTVKRQPAASTDRPFVIVVADTNDQQTVTTEQPAYDTDSTPSTREATTVTTAITGDTTFVTEESTPFSFSASSSATIQDSRLSTSIDDDDLDTSTASPPATFVPYSGVDIYTLSTSVSEEKVRKPVGDENFTRLPVETAVPSPYVAQDAAETITECPEPDVGYGCRPTATAVRTTGAYHAIRFPAENFDAYSAGDRKKNGFVRFPDRLSVSPYRPSPAEPFPYGIRTRPDGDGMSSASTSSGASWYPPPPPPPPSWFPFFQSRKNWMSRYGSRLQYENVHAARPLMPVSSVFRKQYHDYRPPSSAWLHTR